MSWIMTKRGSQDNIITYEHYCDTFSDLSNIPSSQVTLGSTAVVINDEDDGLGIYMANSQKEWVPISTSIGGGSGGITLDLIHICSSEEYNSSTKVPTIEDAEVNKIYLVPNNSNGNNLFDEWIYADDAWEKIGEGNINIPVSDVQVNGTSIVDGSGVANVPIASASSLGVVKILDTMGIAIFQNGILAINAATTDNIKSGGNASKPITPYHQSESTFYGLATAAGDTTQSQSNNAIGTYTSEAKTAIKSMLGVNVDDVQVNGTSVVSNGVANVPVATSSVMGVVSAGVTSGYYGVEINNGQLQLAQANDSNIKLANNSYRPITSSKQHQAVFYGLAKAAGDTTQKDSSNAVGTYTDAAKAAIQSMIGVGITDEVVSGTTPTITGVSNHRYHCGEVASISFTPSGAGICDVVFTSGTTPAVLTIPNTVKLPEWFDATSLEPSTIYEISVADGVYGVVTTWQA